MAGRRQRGRTGGETGGTIKLSIDVDAELHRRLATLAAMQGRTLRDVVVEALGPVASRVRMPSIPLTVATGTATGRDEPSAVASAG